MRLPLGDAALGTVIGRSKSPYHRLSSYPPFLSTVHHLSSFPVLGAQFSTKLGLPPRFAGVTLLALGNGAPDVSSTIASINQGGDG